jgi:4-amino-4-deoxy-L-arabinose transferase-like glycosyltransferase
MNSSSDAKPFLLIVALAFVLMMWGLGSIGLTDRDEGRNAEAGREMFETREWISPTFNYEPRLIKPAMLYWLMSASYWIFGENEFAARFPSALFGVGLIALQYLFLTRERGATVGLFGALMLLLNAHVVGLARMALTDMVLMFFTTLAVFSFWWGFRGKETQRPWLWVLYVATAGATLVKGPVGFLIPLLAIVPYLTVTKQWPRFWRHGFPLRGPALFLALALPWYAAMLMLHGSSYSSQAQEHTLTRFLNPFYGWGGTVFFYVPVVLWGFFPWSGFLPAALYQTIKSWKGRDAKPLLLQGDHPEHDDHELELFAALWFLAVFIFFSLAATRLPHYISPLYPAAAIVAASYWARASEDPAIPGLRTALYTMMVSGMILALAFAALPAVFAAFADKLAKDFPYATQFHFNPGPYAAAAVLVIGMAWVGYTGFSASRRAGVFWAAGTTIALVILITLHVTLPQLSRYFLAPPQELALAAGLQLKPTDRLIIYGPNRPSAVFYAKRKVTVIRHNEEENIRPYLAEPGRTMIVLPAAFRDRLPEEVSSLPVIQERFGWILIAEM